MKRDMKYEHLKKNDKMYLQNKIIVYKKEKFILKLQRFEGKKIDTSKLKQLRRNIAKIKTLLNNFI